MEIRVVVRVVAFFFCCLFAPSVWSEDELWEWVTPRPQGHALWAAAVGNGVTVAVKTGATSAVHPQNLGFHRNALALVTVPLELPDSASFKARADWRGYSIRVIKDYDIENDLEIIRLDVLYGTKAIYPDLGVRLTG